MERKNYIVCGVMSGTSLDGVDIVIVNFEFSDENSIVYHVVDACTVAYSNTWKQRLMHGHLLDKEGLTVLDQDYTQELARIISGFLNNKGHIDFVASHGHTILHQPHKGVTLQIGNRPDLAVLINQAVVCDFRVQDVALGGQGAPLVPMGDKYLYPEMDACINLGGFANVSYDNHTGDRIAFDICPVNIVMNDLALLLGKEYDEGGAFAKTGAVNLKLLSALNMLSYYQKQAPKSLGKEWVENHIHPLLNQYPDHPSNHLATIATHVANQIAFVLNKCSFQKVLVSGGGTYNEHLLGLIKENTSVEIVIPSKEIIEFKEAIVFAYLGVLKWENKVNCLASVTGAQMDHSCGFIYHP